MSISSDFLLVSAAAAECMKQTTQRETIYLDVLYARTKNLNTFSRLQL